MNVSSTLTILSSLEPVWWLLVLLALYFGWRRRIAGLQGGDRRLGIVDEAPPDYRALSVFVVCRLLTSLAYLLLLAEDKPFGLSAGSAKTLYFSVYWSLYVPETVCVFLVIRALLKKSLSPLPGLSSAALIVFRWAAFLALALALTAHIPVFGVRDLQTWVDEVSISFALCVCVFEISLLVLLIHRLERLGMCLRSRPVGLALGLSMLGIMDLLSAMTINLPVRFITWISMLNEMAILIALSLWAAYILLPEPRRNPHSLSPASKLMRWNEIAMKLELSGRQAEQTPFISGVQLVVDSILDKYKIGSS